MVRGELKKAKGDTHAGARYIQANDKEKAKSGNSTVKRGNDLRSGK